MDTRTAAAAIGKDRIAEAMGVTLSAVNEATRSGQFPAAWFLVLQRLGEEAGIDVPVELFRFKGAA